MSPSNDSAKDLEAENVDADTAFLYDEVIYMEQPDGLQTQRI